MSFCLSRFFFSCIRWITLWCLRAFSGTDQVRSQPCASLGRFEDGEFAYLSIYSFGYSNSSGYEMIFEIVYLSVIRWLHREHGLDDAPPPHTHPPPILRSSRSFAIFFLNSGVVIQGKVRALSSSIGVLNLIQTSITHSAVISISFYICVLFDVYGFY